MSYFSSQGTTWGEVDLLNFFGQGPEPNERIGNEIELIGLGIKGNLVGGSANTAFDDPYNVLRLIVAEWDYTIDNTSGHPMGHKQSNGFDYWDLLTKKINGEGLHKKYLDKNIVITSPSTNITTGYIPGHKRIERYILLNGTKVKWFGNNIDSPRNMCLCVSMVSDSLASPNPGFVDGQMILYYKDS